MKLEDKSLATSVSKYNSATVYKYKAILFYQSLLNIFIIISQSANITQHIFFLSLLNIFILICQSANKKFTTRQLFVCAKTMQPYQNLLKVFTLVVNGKNAFDAAQN